MDSISHDETPFIAATSSISQSNGKHCSMVDWWANWETEEPRLRFTKDKAEPDEIQKDTGGLGDLLKDFMPLRINRLALHDGRIEYADEGSNPPVDLALTEVEALAKNLSSVADEEKLLPSTVNATAQLYGGATRFNMALDPLSRKSLFDMDLTVETMDLTKVNDSSRPMRTSMSTRARSRYIPRSPHATTHSRVMWEPVIKDLDVLGKEDRKDNLLRKLWEGIVGTAGDVFTQSPQRPDRHQGGA